MVLFKVDNAARKILQECKEPNTERYTAWYARYVDDMVLIAEDSTALSKLRVAVEDAVKKLDLELVAKEQPLPMSPDQFQDYLTQGKALSASGPVGHVQLFEIDEIKYEEKIERFQSLGLLNDNQLYSQKAEVIIKKINIAANGKDLRHNDLPKVAKWLWYAAALQPADKFSDHSISIINFYIKQWGIVSNHLNPSINPQMCPWEDPLMFALDGLYAAIET